MVVLILFRILIDLSIDLAIRFSDRVLEYLPSLPRDVQQMSQETINMLRHLIHLFQHNKRKYTAR